jgi:hypothetical protein
MAQDAVEIVIAKKMAVYFAPTGTTLPANTSPRTTLAGEFVEAGFTTEDGVAVRGTPDILEVMSAQAARPVRREVQRRDFALQYAFQQWNSANLAHAFGGGEAVETAPGVTTYYFPADEDALDEVSVVADWEDQGFKHRMIWERGNVTEGIESSLIRTGPSLLPVTYSVLDGETLTNAEGNKVPGIYVTDSPAFSPVS